ncbi:MAG: type III pantothenate kinase [Phycisphaerales bacterium]|nr:type III pantothenate kinase [Phycisphaerales bacterium]
MPDTNDILLAAIGNSRLRAGLWRGGEVVDACSITHAEIEEPGGPVERLIAGTRVCVLAGVHRDTADRFERIVRDLRPGAEVMRVGRDVPIHIRHSLDDASTVGQDRLLNAVAAFSRAEQACVVIDAGTAVTVDFVDGEGVLHGGVIAPGVRMMLAALHEHTDGLPEIEFEPTDPASLRGRGPFGKDTPHAMRLGAQAAVVGLVRVATERYAEHYGAYPQVVATGGDAGLFEHEEGLVEHIVPDLQLLGVGLCLDRALADED